MNLDVVFKYENHQWNASFYCDIFHPNVSRSGKVSLQKGAKDQEISLEIYAENIYWLLKLPKMEDICNGDASE